MFGSAYADATMVNVHLTHYRGAKFEAKFLQHWELKNRFKYNLLDKTALEIRIPLDKTPLHRDTRGVMDPNGSFSTKEKPSQSEANISPLEEMFGGTIAKPIMKDFAPINTSSPDSSLMGNTQTIIHAPQGTAMMLDNNFCMMPSERNVSLTTVDPLLTQTKHTTLHPLPVVENIASQHISSEISLNHQEMTNFQEFLSNPLGKYFSSSHQMQIFSMKSSSFRSLLQGDPIAIVHAHLNTVERLDDGPIFHMPNRSVFEVQHGMSSSGSHFGVPTTILPSVRSMHAPREDTAIIGGQNGSSDDANVPGYTSSCKYKCNRCPLSFNTHQALGGHVRAHSKARKKGLED